jgi:hypothetical protein
VVPRAGLDDLEEIEYECYDLNLNFLSLNKWEILEKLSDWRLLNTASMDLVSQSGSSLQKLQHHFKTSIYKMM